MTDFLRALAPVKRRIRLGRLLQGAGVGFAAGAAAALILLTVTAFVPLENRWMIAGLVVLGGILLGAAGNALRRVRNLDAARTADACGLQERCVTALELAEKRDMGTVPFPVFQQNNTDNSSDGSQFQPGETKRTVPTVSNNTDNSSDGSQFQPGETKRTVPTVSPGETKRTVPIVSNETKGTVPIVSLQQRDACDHLRVLDVRQIRLKAPKRLLLIGAGLLVLCAATLLIPGGGDRLAAERRDLREKTAAMARQIDEAEASEEKGLTEQEKAELRKLTDELKRELDESRDSVDALVALDKAEQRLEEFREKTAGDAMQELADAMRNAGLDAAAQALDSGDAAAMQAELSEMSASELQELAEGLSGEAKELAEQLAKMAEAGEMSEAQLQAMMAAAQNGSGALQQALDAMKAMLGGTGASQSGQNGQSGNGAGTGNQGQAGGGAGTGTTNEEQKGSGNSGQQNGAKGNRPAEYKEGQYETIYDPEKIETATRDVSTEQNAQGKDSVQIETGPGKGSLDGDVPYREVVGEYAKTEVQAAENAHLTQEQKEWVDEYFRRLTEE